LKLCVLVFLAALLMFSFAVFSQIVLAAPFLWQDNFRYSSLSDFQAAGWTADNNGAGVSFNAQGVVLDGSKGDSVIRYLNHFPSGLTDWKVQDVSMWLGAAHSGPSVGVVTDKHSYLFGADGYYNKFAFYRDGAKITSFGTYTEQKNVWVTFMMVKQGNTISMFFNGKLEKSFTEFDASISQAVDVDQVSPWKGNQEYASYQFGDLEATFSSAAPASSASSGFPVVPVVVGGGIAAVVVVGLAVYFVFGGAGAGATAGGVAGGGSAGGATGGGGGIHIHNQTGDLGLQQLAVVNGQLQDLQGNVLGTIVPNETNPYIDPYANPYEMPIDTYNAPIDSSFYNQYYETNGQLYDGYGNFVGPLVPNESNPYIDPYSGQYDVPTESYVDQYFDINGEIYDSQGCLVGNAIENDAINAQQQALSQAQAQAEALSQLQAQQQGQQQSIGQPQFQIVDGQLIDYQGNIIGNLVPNETNPYVDPIYSNAYGASIESQPNQYFDINGQIYDSQGYAVGNIAPSDTNAYTGSYDDNYAIPASNYDASTAPENQYFEINDQIYDSQGNIVGDTAPVGTNVNSPP